MSKDRKSGTGLDEGEMFRRAFDSLDGADRSLKSKFDNLDGPVRRLVNADLLTESAKTSPTEPLAAQPEEPGIETDEAASQLFEKAVSQLDRKPAQETLRKKFEARESKKVVKAREVRSQQTKEEYADVLEKQRADREQASFRKYMEGLKVEPGILKQKGDVPIPKAAIKKPDFAKQVKRGKIEGEASIDLHGMRTEEALAAIKRFVIETRQEGLRIVKVITGKGLHSESGDSVVRQTVLSYLHGRGRQYVREFHVPPPKDGGGGALVLFLQPSEEEANTEGENDHEH